MAGLLNYSTSVKVEKTVAEIQKILVKHQVRGVQMRYGADGQIEALAFSLHTSFGERYYNLPVNIDAALAVLEREKEAGHLPSLPWSRLDRAQAARVAWRILKDWLEAQLAVVQCRAVTFEQIMLPYMLMNGKTVYQLYVENQASLPAPENQ